MQPSPRFDPIQQYLEVNFTPSTIGISDKPSSSGGLQTENLESRVDQAAQSARAANVERDLKTLNDHTEVIANLIIRLKHGEPTNPARTLAEIKSEALYKKAKENIIKESSANESEVTNKCHLLANALESHLHSVNLIKAKELLSQLPIESITPPEGKKRASESIEPLQQRSSKVVASALGALSESAAKFISESLKGNENLEPPTNLMGRVKSHLGGYLSKSAKPEGPMVTTISTSLPNLDNIQDPQVKNLLMGLIKSFKYDLQINPDGKIQLRERLIDASSPEEIKFLRSPAMQRKSEFTLKVLKSIVSIQNGGNEVVDPKDPDRRAVKEASIRIYGLLESERRNGNITSKMEEFLRKAGGQFPGTNQLLHNPLIVEESILDKLNNQAINTRHAIDIARFINSGSLTIHNHTGQINGNDKKANLLNLVGVIAQNLGLNREQYVEIFRNGIELGSTLNIDEEVLARLTNDALGNDNGYQKGIGRILNACAQGQILGTTGPLQMLLQLPVRPKLVKGPTTSIYFDTNPDSSTKQNAITQEMDVSIDPTNSEAIIHVRLIVIFDNASKFKSAKTTFTVSPDWNKPSDEDVRKSLMRTFQESGYL